MDVRSIIAPTVNDREALEEFADALGDRAPEIERDVTRLRKNSQDRELIADLFRAIHNVKGDAALCKFDLAVAIAHPIETVLSRFREGEIGFSDLLGETLLLAIDRLELATDGLLTGKSLDNLRLLALVNGLESLAAAPGNEIDDHSRQLIESVTGFPPVIGSLSSKSPKVTPPPADHRNAPADLQFFRSLALQFESRSPLFKGRTMRVLRLALETNRAAGSPVDAVQLEAAVYLHDVGMMFLPESTWLKVGKMTDDDRIALRNHPGYGAGLLQRIPGWEAAAEMIAQHHEMHDGKGYPGQLPASKICPGAKILSIVDAFEAVMLKHIHRGKNRSVLRAIAEVNACDNQFAPEWILPFNTVIRKTIES
ncbi:MAG: HD domain-containing protein [Betaproteobacteria bacterium]|jgi:HD-GYP domain-containing protein (c-di-GMP phosphodiesterase class II)|nr:HD domain-containing protein [Betaproteobacteria bacterium]HMV22190.1 HD domain-containing phosphohydrolase [Rhodocyclaceae bacterium]HNE44263.1 HD domain-containing phosphohydrolase [Rhodocyclaceae bacterium]HNL22627.1 HD domain-containing phosphohydrolase [Rhodocyclaceae bacterium]HNM22520.1 HD domain-containing phosphohydrolase [Rhodocyclaceae bacterium]